MELPAALREAVNRALNGVLASDLAKAASALSQRYRAETHDGRYHVSSDLAARAYLAARLPATFAAVRAAMALAAEVRRDFAPATLLDVGAGPGTALWAAAECWPDIASATLVEGSPAMRNWGETLAREARVPQVAWARRRRGSGIVEVRAARPRHAGLCVERTFTRCAGQAGRQVMDADRRHVADRRAGNAGGLVAHPARAGYSVARRRAYRCAVPACGGVSVDRTGLVPLRAPRRALGVFIGWRRAQRCRGKTKNTFTSRCRVRLRICRRRGSLPPPQQASGRVALKLCQQDGSSTGTAGDAPRGRGLQDRTPARMGRCDEMRLTVIARSASARRSNPGQIGQMRP